MSQFRVVLDACVLYPQGLRDLLMSLAVKRIFKAHWSEQIHDEWIRNLHENSGMPMAQLQRIRELMDQYTDDALVMGYESLITGLNLPDPDDRHVLAAAIKCGANAIVTLNLKDFPAAVCSAVKKMRQRLKNPPYTASEYLAAIKPRLPNTASMMMEYQSLI